jgi:AcrR family transcriptional regulator
MFDRYRMPKRDRGAPWIHMNSEACCAGYALTRFGLLIPSRPMTEQHHREKLIDAALDLCMRQGYEATTVAEIAAAAGISRHAAASYFATTDAIVLSVIDDIVTGSAAALADVAPQTSPADALLAASIKVLADITNGVGVITRERLEAVAHILTTSPQLQKQASAHRKQVLSVALSDRLGVAVDDRRVWRAVTAWSATVVAAYSPYVGRPVRVDPSNDARVPELMCERLEHTFSHITGGRRPGIEHPDRVSFLCEQGTH